MGLVVTITVNKLTPKSMCGGVVCTMLCHMHLEMPHSLLS